MKADKFSQNIIWSGDKYKEEREYWTNKLSGEIHPGRFPVDGESPEPAEPGVYKAGTLMTVLPPAAARRLHSLSNQSLSNQYAFLLAGVLYLLHRYSGEDDLVVGIPANRNYNLLALRVKFEGCGDFKDLLLKIKGAVSEAQGYSSIPFEKIAQELDLPVGSGGFPVFRTFLLLENFHSYYSTPLEKAGIDTLFSFKITGDRVQVKLQYNCRLYDTRNMEQVRDHLVRLLEETVENPGLKLDEISLLTPEEVRRLLLEFNSTKKEIVRDKCYHHLFEEQAFKFPHRTAAVYRDRHITYCRLNREAQRLAG